MSTPTTRDLLVLGELEGQCGGEAHAAAAAGGVDAGDALGVLVGVDGVQVAKQCVAGAEAVAVDAAEVGRGGGPDGGTGGRRPQRGGGGRRMWW